MIRKGWLAAAGLAAALAAQAQAVPGAAQAPAADAERQLQAIREALLAKTLSAPVRVQSYGWIDEQGRLHESTQFTSDTRVRGVRVQAYVADADPAATPADPASVQVDAEVLPSGLGPRADSDPQRCLASPRRWRQALHVEAVLAPGLAPTTQLSQLAARAQRAFLEAARDSRRWVALARPAQPATAYQQALFGRDLDRTEWLARIELSGSPADPQVRVEVGPLHHAGMTRRVTVSPGSAPQSMAAALSAALGDIERQGACDPLWYAVAGSGDELHLREGRMHGLQPGDRLLLVDRRHLPGRLLEPGAARALALVQVGIPSASGTPLQWLAGPRPAPGGDWVVLPL